MDPVFAALLGILGGLVACGVAWAIIYRRSVARPLMDVDELAVEVERIGRVVRRLNMQAVRRGPEGAELPPAPNPLAPGPGIPVIESKADLRRRIFSER